MADQCCSSFFPTVINRRYIVPQFYIIISVDNNIVLFQMCVCINSFCCFFFLQNDKNEEDTISMTSVSASAVQRNAVKFHTRAMISFCKLFLNSWTPRLRNGSSSRRNVTIKLWQRWLLKILGSQSSR